MRAGAAPRARASARRCDRAGRALPSRAAGDSSTRRASASSPCTHGPHWRALWSASQRATRAVSATGQASSESSSTTPAPSARRAARGGRRRARRRASRCAVDPGAGVAADQRRAHARGRAAGGVDQRGQRGAVLDLVHARVGDRAGQRDERRAGLARRAELAEPRARRGARSARRARASRRC